MEPGYLFHSFYKIITKIITFLAVMMIKLRKQKKPKGKKLHIVLMKIYSNCTPLRQNLWMPSYDNAAREAEVMVNDKHTHDMEIWKCCLQLGSACVHPWGALLVSHADVPVCTNAKVSDLTASLLESWCHCDAVLGTSQTAHHGRSCSCLQNWLLCNINSCISKHILYTAKAI